MKHRKKLTSKNLFGRDLFPTIKIIFKRPNENQITFVSAVCKFQLDMKNMVFDSIIFASNKTDKDIDIELIEKRYTTPKKREENLRKFNEIKNNLLKIKK